MNQIIGIVIVALAILVQLAACYESRKIVYIHILDIISAEHTTTIISLLQ